MHFALLSTSWRISCSIFITSVAAFVFSSHRPNTHSLPSSSVAWITSIFTSTLFFNFEATSAYNGIVVLMNVLEPGRSSLTIMWDIGDPLITSAAATSMISSTLLDGRLARSRSGCCSLRCWPWSAACTPAVTAAVTESVIDLDRFATMEPMSTWAADEEATGVETALSSCAGLVVRLTFFPLGSDWRVWNTGSDFLLFCGDDACALRFGGISWNYYKAEGRGEQITLKNNRLWTTNQNAKINVYFMLNQANLHRNAIKSNDANSQNNLNTNSQKFI